MLKINVSAISKKIDKYVKEYYALKSKPDIPKTNEDLAWINSMIYKNVEYAIMNIELEKIKFIEVNERVKPSISYFDDVYLNTRTTCVQKRGYKIEKPLKNKYDLSTKFLLEGGDKVAKVEIMRMWNYKQKNEMHSMINHEFMICKKASDLKIGPKTFDAFICKNSSDKSVFKVIVSEYIKGLSLKEWLDKDPSDKERLMVFNIVKSKINKMHESGIIHNKMSTDNIILKLNNKNKVVDALITDFVNSYDVSDKTMWDYNKWIQYDRDVLNDIKNTTKSYSHANDVINYVAYQLQVNKDIIIS